MGPGVGGLGAVLLVLAAVPGTGLVAMVAVRVALQLAVQVFGRRAVLTALAGPGPAGLEGKKIGF